MTTLAIVLIALGTVVLLLVLGGLLGARRRDRLQEPTYARHLAEADQALEQARATDRGWERATMEAVARSAVEEAHPDAVFERLELVLVEDRPGVSEDRAQFEAIGRDGRVRVVVARGEAGWFAERVG